MIQQKYRFHGYGSLNYLYRNGEVVYLKPFVFKYVKNKFRKNPRIAVVISKKVLKSAVKRNRVRRQLYEHVRPLIANMNGNYDMAFIVTKPHILTVSSKELTALIKQAMVEAGIYK